MRGAVKALRDDQRGAVMLTGLFLAFFLVGALWYVIGIGDAIVFRNRMQEAADSAAFSSAAIHAKGMNFISVCNIIMLIMAAVHIVAGLVQDATIIACGLTGIVCPAVPFMVKSFHNVASAMKTGITATANVSSVIAIGAPLAGAARGYQVGAEYGNQGRAGDVRVLAIGPSTIPGIAGGEGVLGGSRVPLGLPVRGEKYSELCRKVGKELWETLMGAARSMLPSGAGKGFRRLMSRFVGDSIGDLLKVRYCNDMSFADDAMMLEIRKMRRSTETILQMEKAKEENAAKTDKGDQLELFADKPELDSTTNGGTREKGDSVQGWSSWFDPGFDRGWGDQGFLVTEGGAENGTDFYQIWAFARPEYLDTSERRIGIGGSIHTNGQAPVGDSQQGPPGFGYVAQAEFYYDCSDRWSGDTCNGGKKDYNASFGINWRARLRRVDNVSFAALGMRFLMAKTRGQWADRIIGGLRKFESLDRLFKGNGVRAIAMDVIARALIDEAIIAPTQEELDKYVEKTRRAESFH